MIKFIVNADDFGVSQGVNQAVKESFKNGCLTSTSLIVNAKYTAQAIKMVPDLKGLNVGLHFNLTQAKSLCSPAQIPLLVDSTGRFKNGFVKLLILSYLFPKSFRAQVALELDAQINEFKEHKIKLTHLDAHRHIQMIPSIFKLFLQFQKKEQIDRIRIVNENLFYTLRSRGDFYFLKDGGLIKYAILKFLYYWNHTPSPVYFYSILHTGRLFSKNVQSIQVPRKYQTIEVGIHPSVMAQDKNDKTLESYLFLPNRRKEFETVMNSELF